MMSSHVDLPRQGHLDQVLHIFGYLKKHHNAEIVLYLTDPDINMSQFENQDWYQTVYSELAELIPPNTLLACVRGVRMIVWVDSDHAGEFLTRQSQTGHLIFLNGYTIYWFSKKIPIIETSAFGAELCAIKQATKYFRGLCYKLRMMILPCDDPTYIYGGDQYVLDNTSAPASQLKKKSNSIAYDFFVKEWHRMNDVPLI